jgi:periplasmic divalent cation tolerance protein
MEFEHVEISTTTRSKEDAEALAAGVVEARLGACAQVVGPIVSTYWWNGEMQKDEEWSCSIKTTGALTDKALAFLSERHPYDNPELAVVPIVGGTGEYLEWISKEVSG